MLSKEKLEIIRDQIKDEPEDSPAKILLSSIDEEYAYQYKQRLNRVRDMFKSYGHTDEECEKFLVEYKKDNNYVPERVLGTCSMCAGLGQTFHQGCMGGSHEQCHGCEGSGQRHKFKVPE